METERPGLLRLWIEFDLPDLQPSSPGGIVLDGEPPLHRLLSQGIGVTGYDEEDCLRLIADVAGEPLPSVRKITRDPAVQVGPFTGNPAWRGIWSPGLNTGGPVLDG